MNAEDIAAKVLSGLPATTKRPSGTEDKGSTIPSASQKAADSEAPKKRTRAKKKKFVYPVEPRMIQVVSRSREYTNHTYRDFSQVPPEVDDEIPNDISAMTFSQQMHDILSQDEYSKRVAWLPHGRAFKVLVPSLFEKTVCPKYWGHKRYSSFLRALNNHGFKHLTKGIDRNAYYHECFLRGLPHLCKYMPDARDARRLIPDPENEPDFYEISKVYPVPGGKEEDVDDDKKPAAMVNKPEAIVASKQVPLPPPEAIPQVAAQAAMSQSVATLRDSQQIDAVTQLLLSHGNQNSLRARLASEVPWLAAQVAPAKRPALLNPPQVFDAAAAQRLSEISLLSSLNRQPLPSTSALNDALLAAELRAQQQQRQEQLLLRQLQLQQQQLQQQQQQQQQSPPPNQTGSIGEWLRQQSRKR